MSELDKEKFFLAALMMQRALKAMYDLSDSQEQEIHQALSYMMKGISSYADNLKRGLWVNELSNDPHGRLL